MSVRWNLDHILPRNEFSSLQQTIRDELEAFVALRPTLTPEMPTDDFVSVLAAEDRLSEHLYRLYDLPALMEAADVSDTEAKKMKSQALQLVVESEDATRFFSHWIQGLQVDGLKQLDNQNAERLFTASEKHRFLLTRARELAAHTLSEPEEKLASQKNANLKEALLDVRKITETAQEYQFQPESADEPVTIETQSELMQYVHHPKADHRKAAYEALFKEFTKNTDTYFSIFQGIQKDWDASARMRGYTAPVAMRNAANDLESDSVDLLLDICSSNASLFQRFFELKAKILDVKKLSRFDLYAPYPDTSDEAIPYEEAVKMVMDTFSAFHPPFAEKAQLIIDEGHVDSHPRKTKSSGAFCATVTPDITPYVMLNYTGKLRDVSVLAHELGHGVHSLYANKQSISGQHPTLPMAETASTFGELLVFDRLLEEYDDAAGAALLFDKLSDSYATIMRQAYFARFEILAHDAIQTGVSAEELSDLYFSTLEEQFGDSMSIDPIFRYEWVYIPHMVRTPFYVYAYAFGELLSLALYARYKEDGRDSIPVIEAILSAGRTEYPHELLKEHGISISDEGFWNASFALIEQWLETLSKSFT